MYQLTRNFFAFLAAAMVLIGVSGCGMGDYLHRMDAQQKRVLEFDEINTQLDDPIDMPRMEFFGNKEEKPAWPYEIYVRLPKGFGMLPKEKAPYYVNFAFFRYGGPEAGYSIFIIPAFIAEGEKKQEINKYFPARFREYVKSALEDYHFKTNKVKLTLLGKVEVRTETVKRFSAYADDGNSIVYTTYDYKEDPKAKDPSIFRVYVHEENGKQVCLVEHRPLRPASEDIDKAFRKAFQVSLRTLDVSAEAGSRRAQFRKAR